MSRLENFTIFVIDDEEDIRTSLTRSLTKRGYNVNSFSSADSFLKNYDQSVSGCLLLDYGMPDMNGLELQEKLAKMDISTPIIFMTGHGGIPQSVQAIKAGAIDFLEKPFQQKVLLKAIDAAFEQASINNRDVEDAKALKSKFETLTTREKEIAEFIVQNPADTSSKNIGRQLNVSPRTIDHHRARVLEKMDVTSVAELIEKAIKSNL
ncbi:MAG: response regulator, partial [Lentilitoribacter sp.]